jgi:hypothetical protein
MCAGLAFACTQDDVEFFDFLGSDPELPKRDWYRLRTDQWQSL